MSPSSSIASCQIRLNVRIRVWQLASISPVSFIKETTVNRLNSAAFPLEVVHFVLCLATSGPI